MESFHSVAYSSLSQDQSCPICLDSFVPQDSIVVHTGPFGSCHPYHHDCIKTWVMNHPNCPCCQCDVDGISLESRRKRVLQVAMKVGKLTFRFGVCALFSYAVCTKFKKCADISLESIASLRKESVSSTSVVNQFSSDRRRCFITASGDTAHFVNMIFIPALEACMNNPLVPLAGAIAGVGWALLK